MDEFERHGLFALREQGFFGGVELFAQGVGIEAEQVAQIGGQVAGDDGVFVARVP